MTIYLVDTVNSEEAHPAISDALGAGGGRGRGLALRVRGARRRLSPNELRGGRSSDFLGGLGSGGLARQLWHLDGDLVGHSSAGGLDKLNDFDVRLGSGHLGGRLYSVFLGGRADGGFRGFIEELNGHGCDARSKRKE